MSVAHSVGGGLAAAHDEGSSSVLDMSASVSEMSGAPDNMDDFTPNPQHHPFNDATVDEDA